ncbi:MAG TPA: hypothetical protein VN285_02505 [Candidatus Deferrimicrobium sp.]|nr:hypothetical protein [Candidatus Deferrimicrobium sp.]
MYKSLCVALCLGLPAIIGPGCGRNGKSERSTYRDVPRYVRSVTLVDGQDTLVPVRLQFVDDTLFVSYNGLPRLDLYNRNLERVRTIPLTQPGSVVPTSFTVVDSILIVADHTQGAILCYNRQGDLLTSYGRMPDNRTSLHPFAVTAYGGVLYAADVGLRRVLAISLVDADGITEKGEVILAIPSDSTRTLGFPAAVVVTPDGRLLVGDAVSGSIDVFTCDGRFIYRFDTIPGMPIRGPQAFAMDGERDPELQDTTTFDPSDVRLLGRVHVVDAASGTIHMFNTLGKYIASYPEARMQKPSGIAVDMKTQQIYIADPAERSLHVFHIRP